MIHGVYKCTCYQSKYQKTNSSGPLHSAFKSMRLLCRSRALSFGIARECGIERRFAFLENNTRVQGYDICGTAVRQQEEVPFGEGVHRAMIYVILLSVNRRKSLSERECTGAVRVSVISGFRQGVNEIFALQGSYAT